ncbi:aldo/keto reductase [Planctomycetota bacterium]
MALPTVKLGSSGLEVTELCLGTLTMSPIQADMPPDQGGALIRKAIDEGITFIDAAQGYRVYPHMRAGLAGVDRERLVIVTKSHAHTADEMQAAFDDACSEMAIPYIDIFHLHLLASPEDFDSRTEALDKLKELRDKGLVKAIGVSAHSIAPFRHVIDHADIDIFYPTFNQGGFGINDGTIEEMTLVMQQAVDKGKGTYAMKPLGGGHLRGDFTGALDFVRGHDCIHAVSIGMKDETELELNLAYFRGEEITDAMKAGIETVDRQLMINGLCKQCGACIKACEQGALSMGEDKTEVDMEKCIFCGYCAPECPVFAIRVI